MAILHVKSEFYLLSHLQNVTVCLEHIHATAFFQQYLGVGALEIKIFKKFKILAEPPLSPRLTL